MLKSLCILCQSSLPKLKVRHQVKAWRIVGAQVRLHFYFQWNSSKRKHKNKELIMYLEIKVKMCKFVRIGFNYNAQRSGLNKVYLYLPQKSRGRLPGLMVAPWLSQTPASSVFHPEDRLMVPDGFHFRHERTRCEGLEKHKVWDSNRVTLFESTTKWFLLIPLGNL